MTHRAARQQLGLGIVRHDGVERRAHVLALAQILVAHCVIEKGALAVPELRRAESA